METIEDIVARARKDRASDVHASVGVPLRFRVDGRLQDAGHGVLSAADTDALCRSVAGSRFAEFERTGELDMAATIAGIRCRINIYRAHDAAIMALRLLAEQIPALDELGLPPIALDFPGYNKGIVIVTGETGSGKSTTLAAILQQVNTTRHDHIITLEDPIEYLYTPDKCNIDQREIGRDTESFAVGLRSVLREDPDVVLIGEMRDLDTIETALTAAETGHLVFGTLHTQSAPDSIDRLVDVFPSGRQQQIRLQLSQTLRAVVSQQLLPRVDRPGRVLAAEVMVVNDAIRNLIREGKTPQIMNSMATSADIGSVTMDNRLLTLVHDGVLDRATAESAAHDRTRFTHSLR